MTTIFPVQRLFISNALAITTNSIRAAHLCANRLAFVKKRRLSTIEEASVKTIF